MTDFRYDDYELEEEEDEHSKVMKKQEQFRKNYDDLMKDEGDHEKTEKPELNPKQPSKKQEPKKEDSKKPPIPQPSSNASTKSKLIEQHLKLKSQLKELATKMDEIVQKEKQKRKKKLHMNAEEEDERVIELKNELREQEIEINKNKIAIDKLRKNLDYKYDIHKIVQKEDQLKLLKSQVAELEKQKKYLQKINNQEKTFKTNEDKELKERYDRMKAQISELTQKNKRHIESINEKEKQIRKLHENYVTKESKIKQIQVKLNSKKQTPQNDDIEYAISQLQDSIKELTVKKEEIQREGQERLKELERQKRRLKNQADRRRAYLEQKQKELKINKIQYQDVVRLVNTANAKPKKQANDDAVSKASQKRKVNKGGRQRPKIPKNEQQQIGDAEPPRNTESVSEKQKHSVGAGSAQNNGYDDYTNAEFDEEEK